MNLESWITAHVNMYRYFGGSSRILVRQFENCVQNQTGTICNQQTYHEMAEHYQTAIIPAQ